MLRPIEYTLAEALCRHAPGLVATAIEKFRCYGYDQFGRVQELGETGKIEALNVVAAFCEKKKIALERDMAGQFSSLSSYEGQYGIFEYDDSHPAWSYGWYKDDLPPIFAPDYAQESAEKSEGPMTPVKQEPIPTKLGRRDLQIEAILALVARLEYAPLNIPYGGKKKMMIECCLSRPTLFTESGFERAWIEARDRGLVRMEKHEIYARR